MRLRFNTADVRAKTAQCRSLWRGALAAILVIGGRLVTSGSAILQAAVLGLFSLRRWTWSTCALIVVRLVATGAKGEVAVRSLLRSPFHAAIVLYVIMIGGAVTAGAVASRSNPSVVQSSGSSTLSQLEAATLPYAAYELVDKDGDIPFLNTFTEPGHELEPYVLDMFPTQTIRPWTNPEMAARANPDLGEDLAGQSPRLYDRLTGAYGFPGGGCTDAVCSSGPPLFVNTPTAATPEPMIWLLTIIAVGGIGGALRTRRHLSRI